MVEDMLKMCDLHMVYIKPGIFGELVLKKKYGSLLPTITPPEFPSWTDNAAEEPSNDSVDVSSHSLLNTFLNINPDTGVPNLTLESSTDSVLKIGNADLPENIVNPDHAEIDTNGLDPMGSPTSPTLVTDTICVTLISLKENCIHVLLRHSQTNGSCVQNLVWLCADVMSWEPNT